MIARALSPLIEKRLNDRKAIIILGPRQAGKTTLLQNLTKNFSGGVRWWNGDEADIRSILSKPTTTRLQGLIGKNKWLVVDEAQRIENIGICLKLIIDNIPAIKVIASGSSAFELANKINEPLTGRKWEYHLYPLSYEEMAAHQGLLEERRLLEHRMVFGYYPEIVNHPGEEKNLLKQIAGSYLYKDILTWEKIHKPDRLEKLVQALAWQVGSQVSYHELGQITGLDNETVEKYIDLLEKAFIVFRLSSFSRNLRNELKKTRKIYFYDNGLRNAVINQFNPIAMRNDKGALWENFLVSERLKHAEYASIWANRYFWRTHAQQEIDFIEERDGKLFAWEFKWGKAKKTRFPKAFIQAYPENVTQLITTENVEEFIMTQS